MWGNWKLLRSRVLLLAMTRQQIDSSSHRKFVFLLIYISLFVHNMYLEVFLCLSMLNYMGTRGNNPNSISVVVFLILNAASEGNLCTLWYCFNGYIYCFKGIYVLCGTISVVTPLFYININLAVSV